MSDTTKIGVKVDQAVWEQFREDVEDRHGYIRGVLGKEVEIALRQYLEDDSSPEIRQLDEKVSAIAEAVGAEVEGVDLPDYSNGREHARPSERVPANGPTEKKVRWLAGEVVESVTGDRNGEKPQQIPKDTIREIVVDRYGFRSETAQRYVRLLIDHFGYVEHPDHDHLLVTTAERERIVAERRADVEQQVNQELDKLTQP